MTNALDVYLYGTHVARGTKRGRTLRFEYLPEYVTAPGAVPISILLPVTPGAQPSDTVHKFLENLLPDRPDVKRKWAQAAGLTREEPFDLLSVYGADVTGALEFYPVATKGVRESALIPVTEAEIADRIRGIRADDSEWLAKNGNNNAFSLGGAQGKFALARHNGQWFLPTGEYPSTHIFKPGVKGYEGSDITEHVMLRTARLLGLAAAASEIGTFDGEHTLIVERFDRAVTENGILRLHQEDLAQATGTASLNKYERDSGPSYLEIFGVFDAHLSPTAARGAKARFAQLLVFSWITGHNDGHSKNYSITHIPGAGSTLAPFYDLNSILPFQPEGMVLAKDYTAFDGVQLAFEVHGATAIGEYTADTIGLLERDAELPAGTLVRYAASVAVNIANAVNAAIDSVPANLRDIPAVRMFPYAFYSQSLRVRDVLRG